MKSNKKSVIQEIIKIRNYCIAIFLVIGLLLISFFGGIGSLFSNEEDFSIYSMNYDIEKLSNSDRDSIILYGYKLFSFTSELLGNNNLEDKYVGNGLSCTNCHLENGTKAYAIPLIGVDKRFPQYRGRENKIGTLEERINGCFERSMNGKKLPIESEEMRAFIAYIKWIGRYVERDEKVNGIGLKSIKIPNRIVNLNNGKLVYQKHCVICHGEDGKGVMLNNNKYEFPPLWGEKAYNNGAGMTRVITAAQFIKYNMPNGTTFNNPVLNDDEAYDVAGYINQQKRPEKNSLLLDFPNLLKKPVSTPYPPYADNFSEEQHQLGPFQPIIKYYLEKHQISKTK